MGYNLTLKILTNPETLRSFIDLETPSFLNIIHFHERFLFIVLFNLVNCGLFELKAIMMFLILYF